MNTKRLENKNGRHVCAPPRFPLPPPIARRSDQQDTEAHLKPLLVLSALQRQDLPFFSFQYWIPFFKAKSMLDGGYQDMQMPQKFPDSPISC